jgi:hypothetical protein
MNVVVFNYLNRPIFEVMLNHRIDGVAPPIGGGKSIVAGASIPLGVQVLTWRLGGPEGAPRNGETIIAKNPLALSADEIPNESAYLAIHVYPDATAELTFSKYLPDPTARGQEIIDNSKN